jgi:hypothetical protein
LSNNIFLGFVQGIKMGSNRIKYCIFGQLQTQVPNEKIKKPKGNNPLGLICPNKIWFGHIQ